MSTTIEIRDVPDALYRRLETQATLAAMPLSDYLLRELHKIAEKPTMDGMRVRLRHRSSVSLTETPADAVRAIRGRE